MKNYYKILEINSNSTKQDILNAYKFKISRFNNLPFLTQQMISDIKDYKTAYYILLDQEKRKKYNNLIFENKINTKISERLFSLKNN